MGRRAGPRGRAGRLCFLIYWTAWRMNKSVHRRRNKRGPPCRMDCGAGFCVCFMCKFCFSNGSFMPPGYSVFVPGKGVKPLREYKKSRSSCSARAPGLVRMTGLEPVRHGHTHLKRACLPVPAHPHRSGLNFRPLDYYSGIRPVCQPNF